MKLVKKRLIWPAAILLFTLPAYAEDAIARLGQLRLDPDLNGIGVVHDPARTGHVLRRPGALQERPYPC